VTVTTTLDPATPIAGQLSLREAIALVNAGQVADNTIILPTGTYAETQGELNVTHSLILQGAGAAGTVIDGGGMDRDFFIIPGSAVNVQFSGLTIRNGKTGGFGGGIDVVDMPGQSSALSLIDCVVSGNTARGGGGISNFSGDVTLTRCQVIGNQATGGEGGGVALFNGGTGNLTVLDSTVSGNSASEGGGGLALLHNSNPSSLTITGSTINNNTVTTAGVAGGGGIVVSDSGPVQITDTVISGNTALLDGGGFESYSLTPASITFTNDTITGNESVQGNGGGLAILDNAPVTLECCTVADNFAALSGGGLNDSGNGTVTIGACTFDGNESNGGTGGGGVDYTGAGSVQIANSIFRSNTANNALSTGGGGGLEVNNAAATLAIVNSLFADNTASAGGGGVGVFSGLTATITGSTFVGNRTLVNFGGGINLVTTGTNAGGTASSLSDDTIVGNLSVPTGGGVEVFGGDFNFTSDTITGNVNTGVNVNTGTAFFLDNIIARNTRPGFGGNGPDVNVSLFGNLTSRGGNVIGVGTNLNGVVLFAAGTPNANGDFAGTVANPLNPLLGPLQDNGGILAGAPDTQQVVPTEALMAGSPVIGIGVAGAPTTDERSFGRPGGRIDSGAFEFQGVTLAVAVTPVTVTPGQAAVVTVTVTNTSGNPLPADNSTLTVTLPPGLLPLGGTTFTVGALPAGRSVTFRVPIVATTLGAPTITATVTSPDANPGSVTASAVISVVPPSDPTTNATVPPGTPLSPPFANLVSVFVLTVKRHGKKFLLLSVVNNTGGFILGRLVLAGLSLKQYAKLLGLSAGQLSTIPTFDGFPVVDLFLAPDGEQTVPVPAGGNFIPVVIAGL
jgi:hypothetical protein